MRLSLIVLTGVLLAADLKMSYPPAKRVEQADVYNGVRIEDPYRWLEDADSPETKAWVTAQNALTEKYLGQIPGRERIRRRLTELWNFERYADFFKAGGRYFFLRNDGLQNQSVLYTLPSIHGPERALLDPNTLSKDGTVALAGFYVSNDGKLLAYAISRSGSDWQEWRVRNIDTGQDLPDLLVWSKFSTAAWSADNKGFYYQRFAEPKTHELTAVVNNAKLYYHWLGAPQSSDELIYERPDQKDWQFEAITSEDGRYLIAAVSKGAEDKNMVLYRDLKAPGATMTELVGTFDGAYIFLGNQGKRFYFRTTGGAARGRIIAIDLAKPERKNWTEIVGEQKETLREAQMASGMLALSYLRDAYGAAKIYKLDGAFVRDVVLPGIGTIYWSQAHSTDTELFYGYTSFTAPNTMYRYDLKTGASSVARQSKLSFDPSAYETRQIFYNSKDGTRVPMFLVHKKGLTQNGANPTILYGYGGFNISVTPTFTVSTIEWIEHGGIYAVANLRGGGEYGESWHEAGTKRNKQNVFDDFIAAAEWLISNKYTSTPKLAISGRSNGGLLVGATLNQRPDLFGAALPAVGVMDMLRFHKFTIGWAWTVDYGSPEQAQAGPAPILIRIDVKAGHGAGKPTTKLIEEWADSYAFLEKALDLK